MLIYHEKSILSKITVYFYNKITQASENKVKNVTRINKMWKKTEITRVDQKGMFRIKNVI